MDRDVGSGTPNRLDAGAELRAIGAVAREVGLTPRAIRYYEELGLLRPAVRVKGADRLFDASDVQRLREIKRLRDVIGFSLAEIAELLDADAVRDQLRTEFEGTADPAARLAVLHRAAELCQRRLRIAEQKLAQVRSVRDEELARLDRLRAMVAREEARLPAPESRRHDQPPE